MKGISKILLLAAMAVAALAFAGTASAATAVWTQEEKALEEGEPTLSLNGYMHMSFLAGGFECPASAEVALEPNGGTGKVTAFGMDETGCTIGGELGGACYGITAVTPKGLPWDVDAENEGGNTYLKIAEIRYTVYFSGGASCPTSLEWVGSNVHFNPDVYYAMSNLEFSSVFKVPGAFNSQVTGSMEVEPAGVYGFE